MKDIFAEISYLLQAHTQGKKAAFVPGTKT